MKQLVEDETGGKWVIMPEDPAWWAVKELRREMEYVVLTSTLITTGHLGEVDSDQLTLDAAATAFVYEKSDRSPAIGKIMARKLRLRVCLDRVGEMEHEEE